MSPKLSFTLRMYAKRLPVPVSYVVMRLRTRLEPAVLPPSSDTAPAPGTHPSALFFMKARSQVWP